MPKKISDLTAVTSIVSSDHVEISRNATSSVKRDLYDEFADQLGNIDGMLWNVGVNATVAASALSIFLTQADGASNPSTSINRSRIAYHATAATTGGYVIVDSIATTSTVISAGSTGGAVSASPVNIFVYALNNAGTTEVGWITGRTLDESILHTSTAEGGAGAADSRGVFYSTTARANVAVRLIGIVTATEATAGTWATAPSAIATLPIDESNIQNTWTPIVTAGTGTITTLGTVSSRFMTKGRLCFFEISITITTNGTGAGNILFTLPFTCGNIGHSLYGRANSVSGKSLQGTIGASASSAVVYNYDNTYPGASGETLVCTGWYEMAAI